MTLPDILLLFFVALLAGTLNAVAGGGSFFAFPALVFTGVPSIPANATNTIALWPGQIASIGAYRKEFKGLDRSLLILLMVIGVIGGAIGAILLVKTPSTIFQHLIPYLLLLATLLFAFSPTLTGWLQVQALEKTAMTWKRGIWITVVQLVIAIYGGYFGGGIGIMILASLALMGMENIHTMNAVKTVMTSFINGVAVVTFIIFGIVLWPQALLMIVASVIGGYGGAYYAKKLDPRYIRIFVIIVGLTMTVIFFFRQ